MPSDRGGAAAVAGLGALTVATFCLATSENLPAGLLPQISAGLGTSLSAAGQLVTGYALTVAVTSVPLTRAAARIPRRLLLAGLMAVFVLGSLGSATAPDYGVLLASRVVTALTHAVFYAVVTVTAAELFAPSVRGRVIAVVLGAGSVATMLGVPAGTWLGQQAGWRVSFAVLSGIGLAALVTIVLFLPSTAAGEERTSVGTAPSPRRYVVLLVTIMLAISGLSMALTYTVPFLTEVSGFSASAIGPLLLLRGAAGVVALAGAGGFSDRHPRFATNLSVALLAAVLTALYVLGAVRSLATVLVALSGLAMYLVITALVNELLMVAPGDPDVASAGGNVVFNVGIAAGAFLGGLLLPVFGSRSVALTAGLLNAAALAVLLGDHLIRPASGGSGADRSQRLDPDRHGEDPVGA